MLPAYGIPVWSVSNAAKMNGYGRHEHEPHGFWEVTQEAAPELSKFALRLFAVPVSRQRYQPKPGRSPATGFLLPAKKRRAAAKLRTDLMQHKAIKHMTPDVEDEGNDDVMINDEDDETVAAARFNVNDDDMDEENIACPEEFIEEIGKLCNVLEEEELQDPGPAVIDGNPVKATLAEIFVPGALPLLEELGAA